MVSVSGALLSVSGAWRVWGAWVSVSGARVSVSGMSGVRVHGE